MEYFQVPPKTNDVYPEGIRLSIHSLHIPYKDIPSANLI